MFKILMITEDEIYGIRLKEYWKEHCGSDLDISICNAFTGLKDEHEIDLIITDSDKQIQYEGVEIVTLVSDIEQVSEPFFMLKYGKPQELYLKLVALCENRKNIKREKVELKTEFDGKEKILKLSMNEEHIDRYAIETLRNCPIEGLIPIQVAKEKNKDISFYIHGKVSLKDYMDKLESDRQLIQILKDVFDVLIKVEDYMLNRNHLVLDIEHIYLHQITKKPSLIYIPDLICDELEWLEKYQELLTQLSKVSIVENDDINTLKVEINDNKEETFVVRETLNYADKTEFFQTLQKTMKNQGTKNKAKLFWKSKKKDIVIDRNIFKIGKENKFVDFCIDDNQAVSRNHADIVTMENEVFIVDKNSLNHTYINDKVIPSNARILLHDGDLIRFANEEFVFYMR